MPNYIDFHEHVKDIIYRTCFDNLPHHFLDKKIIEKIIENFRYNFDLERHKYTIWNQNLPSYAIVLDSSSIDFDSQLEDSVCDIINQLVISKKDLINENKGEDKMSDNCTCTMTKEPPRPFQDSYYKPACLTEFEHEEERIRLEYEQALADAKMRRDQALFENFKKLEQARNRENAEERAINMKTRYDEYIKVGFDDATAKELMKEFL